MLSIQDVQPPLLIFDTETTGFPRPKLPPTSPEQPDIVQLGLLLVGEGFTPVCTANLIVQTEKHPHPKAVEIHGITHAKASLFGIRPDVAVEIFDEFAYRCTALVAHNIDFDRQLIDSTYLRYADKALNELPLWEEYSFCTMKASTPILKLPPTKRGTSYKWPKLEEAYEHFAGTPMENAHDALADCLATLTVLKGLKGLL